jgi:squalene synthase HpnC
MSAAAHDLASGKGHKDENFPVASVLVEPRYRAPVMAFYAFARAADDVADHESAPPQEKLRLLETMRAALEGEGDDDLDSVRLREVLAERGLSRQHGLDVLEAFRRDVTKLRYRDWAELMDYCRYSASPVGRMVLDIHGESPATWPASDALCSALQVINHLQDCAKDYAGLDRVYLPTTDLAAAGTEVAALAAPRASPALRKVITGLARQTLDLLDEARPLAAQVQNRRLRFEVAFIQRLAEDLARRLTRRDPLCERVHHDKLEFAGLFALTIPRYLSPSAERYRI